MNSCVNSVIKTNVSAPVPPVAVKAEMGETGPPALRELADCAGGQEKENGEKERLTKTMCCLLSS